MGKCQKVTGSPRSVNFGAKNWEEFNFEWVELGGRLKPDLETNPSGMHASPSPGRHLSTPQVELFPWNPLNRGERPVSLTQGCSQHHRRATRIPGQWDGKPRRVALLPIPASPSAGAARFLTAAVRWRLSVSGDTRSHTRARAGRAWRSQRPAGDMDRAGPGSQIPDSSQPAQPAS